MAGALSAALNRTTQPVFLDALQREIDASARHALGLLLVRLGSIDELNFRIGYERVDAALAEFGVRLGDAFGERAAVVRVGTRRFAIVLRDLKSDNHALLAAGRVRRVAEETLQDRWLHMSLNARQGIALFPGHAANAESLLRCAEVALSSAAGNDKGVSLYCPDADDKLSEFGRIEQEVAHALEQGGIESHFQPQVDLATGRVVGAEALLRCRDPRGGFIDPEAVVAVAGRTKQIGVVTAAMFNTALRYAAEWPVKDCALSINITADSLKDPDFVSFVADALEIWGWPPSALTVEITESAFMAEPQQSFAAMHELRAIGVRVAIDDFGTGYSSFSYFTNIPANELKVDKSFVLDMVESAGNRKVVQAVINLAHGFDLKVVAEGVENEQTLDALRGMGCDIAQGYYVGRPMAPAHFATWLSASCALPAGADCAIR
ncbi:MAG: bifunctional diguanylate cyclase/phosphodiesterase [Woeseia sp.]